MQFTGNTELTDIDFFVVLDVSLELFMLKLTRVWPTFYKQTPKLLNESKCSRESDNDRDYDSEVDRGFDSDGDREETVTVAETIFGSQLMSKTV